MTYDEYLDKFANAVLNGVLTNTAKPMSEEYFKVFIEPVVVTDFGRKFALDYREAYLKLRAFLLKEDREGLKELDDAYEKCAKILNLD